ncbi:DASS family sodium-coupled anion symporter [bacterium]|nr:DASS family sodium-coupled anion symporter [bacterium]
MLRLLKKPIAAKRRRVVTRLGIGAVLFVIVLLLPITSSMRQVAVRFTVAEDIARTALADSLFSRPTSQLDKPEETVLELIILYAGEGRSDVDAFLALDGTEWKDAGISRPDPIIGQALAILDTLSTERLSSLIQSTRSLELGRGIEQQLDADQQREVDRGTRNIRLGTALVVFVVFCFIFEAMPFPAVAFTIGLVSVFGGLVNPREIASMFWSDATWFIMGSLMLATALVKTGLDKRISLLFFGILRKPTVPTVTGMLVLVISPLAAVLSDHVLAAIFLPIGLIFYNNSLSRKNPEDPELAKMLMITIAMACNIGGFGTPSGGARNIIVMNYLEDLYGITISYSQWILYAMPFVLVMMVLVWVLVNLMFKPKIRDLSPAMRTLRADITHMGPWNRTQLFTMAIFALAIFGWITDKTLLKELLGFSPGIGVIAVTGAVIYMISGVVDWKDYQHDVDWGVVWLYAGAIVFGRILDQTGTAAWLAGSLLNALSSLNLTSGLALILSGSLITTGLTNLLAAGPTAAAVAPITLEMAASASPGTALIPMMGLATSLASSFAFLIVIGTPPNTIVYSSGHLVPKDFLRVGILATLLAFLVLIGMALYYWPMVLNYP